MSEVKNLIGTAKICRSPSLRLLMAVATAFALLCAPINQAWAKSKAAKYASIAYDVNTGSTLFETFGSARRYPASLTKIMTLYITFELIEQGRMSYNTLIPISAQAASQPPSKLGFKVGEHIKAIDAIKALVTKSANDVAVALAERIAGSEERFARLMTKKARELGMKNTIFKNASGLPDSEQVTTARDMIKLGVRIQDDFPRHYKLFKTRSFRYRGKRYKNHNTLLGSVDGVDGIKTGYIRASGFNLLSSVKRDGKHVVAVVFGGKTARRRNTHMRSIIARALKQASRRKTRRPALIAKPRPVMRPRLPEQKPIIDQQIRVGRADSPRPSRNGGIKIAKVRRIDIAEAPPRPQLAGRRPAQSGFDYDPSRRPHGLQDKLAALLARSGIADNFKDEEQGSSDDLDRAIAARQRAQPASRSQQRGVGDFQIQVGAYGSRREAEAQLSAVARRAEQLLNGYAQYTEVVAKGSRRVYRARFAGFDKRAARATCSELRRRSIDCIVGRQ
ncbi:MAG: D-alanyl-D-alanine carboxypeptidase [Alphaproteobacteria bacterium]|nr:D-alanyl-D-alanine carboxypeptidase [Alphaproteobacteria bacterium]